jgi:hypothetical protein
LFIPAVSDWVDGCKTPPYHEIRNQFLEDGHKGPFVIDIYDADFDESRFSIRPFQGHPSPYGNQVIAFHVADKLKELIPDNFFDAENERGDHLQEGMNSLERLGL